MKQLLRSIPNVNDCLDALLASEKLAHVPRLHLKHCTRTFLKELRSSILAGTVDISSDDIKENCTSWLVEYIHRLDQSRLTRVINATGVIIHTNLGRSLLPRRAIDSFLSIGTRYTNLEFNLETGKRGSRYDHVEDLLQELTGAEASVVVNNNAAAVLLCLETLAKDLEVIVSRGQLVEIGGSFRLPDIMARSGARLVEVGTTNRTHLHDYRQALSASTGMLLKVHSSNFRIIGFTSEVSIGELVQLGRAHSIPVMEDLGSGCLVDLSSFGLVKEPTVQETVLAGADVVTFSGDKLLGGPQAGIIVGKKCYIDKIKKNPLNRALRVDKFTLAGLESVLRLYIDQNQAVCDIPTLAMIAEPAAQVELRARNLFHQVSPFCEPHCHCEIVPVNSCIGGGAMPGQSLASWAVAFGFQTIDVVEMERRLRRGQPPVIGRIENNRLLLDMRTVAEDELGLLATSLAQSFSENE
jgi:L-seryl-tRNA(Ser) seleniumtransferase